MSASVRRAAIKFVVKKKLQRERESAGMAFFVPRVSRKITIPNSLPCRKPRLSLLYFPSTDGTNKYKFIRAFIASSLFKDDKTRMINEIIIGY